MQQDGQRDRSWGRSFVHDFFRQIALRFDEQTFFHNAFVFFERTLDPVYVIAVSIGHLRNDPIIAMAFGAEKQIRNPGYHFTNAELAHCPLPRISIPEKGQRALRQKQGKRRAISWCS